MSPPRRRSSRLAAVSTKTRATPELSSVAEGSGTVEPVAPHSPRRGNNDDSKKPAPTTPTAGDLKPSREEMHPSKCHSSTAPEPSSALRLGFTDIKPKAAGTPDAPQDTPTKMRAPATEFTFRFSRGAAGVPLSENAQRLMQELRDQANIIKADMQAQRALDGEEANRRKTAQPKGKMGRFSAAHMAEFKKMDSIEGHVSAWRANRTPPAPKAALKRSPSKAELDGAPSPPKPSLKRTLSKASLNGTPTQPLNGPSLKRTSSRAKLDDGDSAQPDNVNFSIAGRPRTTPMDVPGSTFAKRIKKFRDDDTSKARPISRDGSNIPRAKAAGQGPGSPFKPSSGLSRLMSPTKASMGHVATPGKPTMSLVNPTPKSAPGPTRTIKPAGIPRPGPSPSKAAELGRRIISPSSFHRAKSILRGGHSESEHARTALPKPAVSQTPGPGRMGDKALPPLPLTTPRRKLVKRVAFTPDTKSAADAQNSPSPLKQSIAEGPSVEYPKLDSIVGDCSGNNGEVAYPDLSGLKDITASFVGQKEGSAAPQSVPGTFTFRSDHTIDFGAVSPSGFGAYPGQASLRQVRKSMTPGVKIPGSFPAPPSPSSHPNKENAEPPTPKMLPGVAHGMPNKKRHRASSEDGDVDKEGNDRGGKKLKNVHEPASHSSILSSVSSGPSLSRKTGKAPAGSRTPGRVFGQAPHKKTPGSATPAKRVGLSMSRLNMLSKPKNRA